VTVERGIDPRDLALVAFGGAGPLHAAAIAAELGMTRVVAPTASGVLSALGLVVSERRRDLVESVLLSGGELGRERVAEVVRRRGGRRGDDGAPEMSRLDPIALQVMVGALRAACEEMGVVLVRSAHSANIKERRDASTALFDARGRMVMQAEHIPVHLGAMPAAVEGVRAEGPDEGDASVLNDPYRGGTHLPD